MAEHPPGRFWPVGGWSLWALLLGACSGSNGDAPPHHGRVWRAMLSAQSLASDIVP